MQPRQPAKSATQDKPRSARVRDHARREYQPMFLRGGIDGSKQTTSGKTPAPSLAVNGHLAHSRQVDDQPAVARAEASQAMSSAAHSSNNASGRGGANRSLHIRNSFATGDEA